MELEACHTTIVELPNSSIIYDHFRELYVFYKPMHTYLSIFLCIVGALSNFCNIVILTRRQMRTPVNTILTAMACCDTVVLFSNLVYTTHYSFVAFKSCHPRHWSYGWALFLIAHAHLSLVGHSSSVWLSVMLALIRYLTLRSRGNMGGMQIGLRHSHLAIAVVIVFVVTMNMPNFLTYKIDEHLLVDICPGAAEYAERRDAPAYLPGIADMAKANHCIVFRLAFWMSGTIFKMVPCVCLSLLVWLLLRILKEVKANHQRLLKSSGRLQPAVTAKSPKKNGAPSNHATSSSSAGGRQSIVSAAGSRAELQRNASVKTSLQRINSSPRGATSRGERTDRTTHMLLAIVVVLLVTEIPQGIMAVLSGILSEEFRIHIYNNVGDFLDLLSLCGACTSFIIYCSMSGQFRAEFSRVFLAPFHGARCRRACRGATSPRRPSDTYSRLAFTRSRENVARNSEDRSLAVTTAGGGSSLRMDLLAESRSALTPLTPLTPNQARPGEKDNGRERKKSQTPSSTDEMAQEEKGDVAARAPLHVPHTSIPARTTRLSDGSVCSSSGGSSGTEECLEEHIIGDSQRPLILPLDDEPVKDRPFTLRSNGHAIVTPVQGISELTSFCRDI